MLEIINQLNEIYHVDMVIVILVFAAGIIQQHYMKEVFPKISGSLKTLFFSFMFFIIYLFIKAYAGTLKKVNMENYFVSYAIATSVYELFVKSVIQMLRKKAGLPEPSDNER